MDTKQKIIVKVFTEPNKEYKNTKRLMFVVKIKWKLVPGRLNSTQIIRNIVKRNKTTKKRNQKIEEISSKENIIGKKDNHYRR